MNRFKECKSLLDLQGVLGDGIDFTSLTPDEQERLVLVFNANAGEDVSLPLTPAAYGFICGETCNYAAKAIADGMFASVTTNSNFEGEKIMKNFTNTTEGVFKNIVNAATSTIQQATENVKVKVGEDTEEFKAKADDSITTCKNALMSVLEKLDQLTGATALKRSLLTVLYDETKDTKSTRGFFDAAAQARTIVYQYIDDILDYGASEQDLKTVAALRYMLAEDEEGKPTGRRSIFTSFANTVVWVCRKVSRTFKRWFGTDPSTNVFGSVGASLASIFGVVAGVLGSALKVALHTLIFVGSYIVTAVIKAVAWVWDMLKKAGNFVKSKVTKEDVAAFDEDVVNEF